VLAVVPVLVLVPAMVAVPAVVPVPGLLGVVPLVEPPLVVPLVAPLATDVPPLVPLPELLAVVDGPAFPPQAVMNPRQSKRAAKERFLIDPPTSGHCFRALDR